MDNEVTELYKNVGAEKIHNCKGCEYEEEYICPDDCPQQQLEYPPFTAEKQLKLIKWSARREPKVEIGYSSVYGYWVENPTDTRYYFGDQFDNALASLINTLWQDLTVVEQEQIRNILKG